MTHVLIVDRDHIVTETTCRQLERRGYNCYLAHSGEEALAVIAAHGTSLSGVITNVDLSGTIDGWDVARRVRQRSAAAAVGYLSATGHRDWAARGVPNSVMIAMPATEHEIADTFFQLRYAEDIVKRDRIAPIDPIEGAHPGDVLQRKGDALQAHFEYTPSFIAFLDGPNHRFVFANDAYVTLVEREVVGRTVIEVMPESVGQGFVDILDRVYSSGEEFIGHGVEFKIDRDHGGAKQTVIDLVYRPIHGSDGGVTGIFVEGTDLTERNLARDRINALQNELIHIARVNAMGLLASTMAHELNQPLTSIHNFMAAATILAEQQSLDPVLRTCLEETRNSALRAGDIIRKLRAMTTRGAVTNAPFAVEPALKEAVATASTGRGDIDISYDLRSTAAVRADRIQFQQIILNLVQNALEAASDSGPELLFSSSDEKGFVRISVQDRGSGMAGHVLPRVFESFSTTKPEGMGVGLSLCKTIVEAHGGAISASNNPGGGATFSFTLPGTSSAVT